MPVGDRLVSSPFSDIHCDNSQITSCSSPERGKFRSTPTWLKFRRYATATVAHTRPTIANLQLEDQQTQQPIWMVGEQVRPADSATQTQRAERRVVFSQTDNIMEYSVPPENNLRSTGDLAALRTARADKIREKPKSRPTNCLKAFKQDAAERALSRATLLAAKERRRQDRRPLQLADSGDAEVSQAKTQCEEATSLSETRPTTAATTVPRSDPSTSECRPERSAPRLGATSQGGLICITEGPSLREIRELRRRQNLVERERSPQESVSETDESFESDSPAMQSLRRLLFI